MDLPSLSEAVSNLAPDGISGSAAVYSWEHWMLVNSDLTRCAVLFGLIADVPRSMLTNACTVYTVARLVYGYVYVYVPDDVWSQARGIAWWTGNGACFYLLWKGAFQA